MGEVRVLQELPGLTGLMAKAALGSFGRPDARAGLPERSAVVLDHRQDPARLAAYDRVTGFGLRDQVSPTWLHVLTFPLHAYLMAERDFPFALAGLVHVSNEMTLLRPVSVTERLRLGVRAQHVVPHKRGAMFDLVGEVHVGDELVWTGTSSYLARGAKVGGEPQAAARLESPSVPPSQLWRLPGDLGRSYAAVSGDTNPIHLSALSARLFGFKRAIVHGMWTHARALAALEPRLGDAYTVRVAFTKPISIPGRVTFAADVDGERWRLAVLNSDQSTTYLVGEVAPPAPAADRPA